MSLSKFETLFSKTPCDCCSTCYGASFDAEPVAETPSRFVFRGRFYGEGKHDEDVCYTKCFNRSFWPLYKNYSPSLVIPTIVKEYAEKFKAKHPNTKSIGISMPFIAKIDLMTLMVYDEKLTPLAQNTRRLPLPPCIKPKPPKVSIEPFLEGNFQHYTSNSGLFLKDSDLLQSFSHFSYEESNHEFIICDLKGIRETDKYTVVDPAICSRQQKYGPSDIGTQGITNFFQLHKCSDICKGYPEVKRSREHCAKRIPAKKSTTYTVELEDAHKKINKTFRKRKDLPVVVE